MRARARERTVGLQKNIARLIANAKIIIVIVALLGKVRVFAAAVGAMALNVCGAFVLNHELRYKSTRNQVQMELGQIFAVNPCAFATQTLPCGRESM